MRLDRRSANGRSSSEFLFVPIAVRKLSQPVLDLVAQFARVFGAGIVDVPRGGREPVANASSVSSPDTKPRNAPGSSDKEMTSWPKSRRSASSPRKICARCSTTAGTGSRRRPASFGVIVRDGLWRDDVVTGATMSGKRPRRSRSCCAKRRTPRRSGASSGAGRPPSRCCGGGPGAGESSSLGGKPVSYDPRRGQRQHCAAPRR